MMRPHTARKVLATVVAAVTMTMVASIAPASAAQKDGPRSGASQTSRDTGWDIP